MTVWQKLKRYMFSADLDEVSYQKVQPQIEEENRHNLMVFSTIACAFLTIMMLLVLLGIGAAARWYVYLAAVIGTLTVLGIGKTAGRTNPKVIWVLVYAFLTVLLMFGIVIGTAARPNETAATFIAFILACPMLFTDRPIRISGLIVVAVVSFCIMVMCFKDPTMQNVDITNAIVFGLISIIMSAYLMKIKVQRYWLEETVRYMGETDQLTGLKNRNCFDRKLAEYRAMPIQTLCCVYVDVNGLHELNDTQGHEAGDRMLRRVAQELQLLYGKEDTYRIGGDEYVAFTWDQTEQEIRSLTAHFNAAVEKAGYHVAVGAASAAKKDLDVNPLIKEAEQKMYRDKRNYYMASGVDRRRRS